MPKKIIKTLLLGLILISVPVFTACAPRGESKTLEQVLKSSQERFSKANQRAGTVVVADVLSQTKDHLETLLSQQVNGQDKLMYETANLLAKLTENAGYTSRPAMTELVSQYRELGHIGNAGQNEVTLLVSRTYSILASELETTKFKL
ncbi:MAG: hypothetical protein KDD56_02910 [Bdellovibrionales bacterium]|nr:hypothetical protein [Bdellovibrionales bacterium]